MDSICINGADRKNIGMCGHCLATAGFELSQTGAVPDADTVGSSVPLSYLSALLVWVSLLNLTTQKEAGCCHCYYMDAGCPRTVSSRNAGSMLGLFPSLFLDPSVFRDGTLYCAVSRCD